MVDDSASFCRVVGAALESEPDIEFRHCQDTSVALAVAAKFGPAVILQDMVMPGVDGLEMIRTYRRHLATEHLPVIVLSASSSVDQKTTAFLVGADDFVAKNAEHVELLARVRYHAGRYLAMQREGLHRHPMARRGSRTVEPKGIKEPVLIHDVVGIDGAHALHLVVTEEELAAPRTPLAFRAYVFEDKAKGAVALEGWVLRVSKRCALVASADPLELDKNLQLTLLSATGATLAEDVFAKVIRVNEVDGHYELRFTSLSAQARAVLSASVAAR